MSNMKKTYSQLRSQLDDVLDALQDPSIDIDQALELYTSAKKLIAELETYLKDTELKIKKATKQ